jgi:hypothetical protein
VNANPAISNNSGRAGSAVFNAIVDSVRKATGWAFPICFNRVLADNADLMRDRLDATLHTPPLLRLFNRTKVATGLDEVASAQLATDKVSKLTSRFFPSLSGAPTALQWDILWRTALLREKCGIVVRLYNRSSDTGVSKADWKAANARADDFLSLLDDQAAASKDFGTHAVFQNWGPENKLRCFKIQIDRLMKDEGLSRHEAFEKLRDTQPVFWAASLLSFEPDKQ